MEDGPKLGVYYVVTYTTFPLRSGDGHMYLCLKMFGTLKQFVATTSFSHILDYFRRTLSPSTQDLKFVVSGVDSVWFKPNKDNHCHGYTG